MAFFSPSPDSGQGAELVPPKGPRGATLKHGRLARFERLAASQSARTDEAESHQVELWRWNP